MLRKSAEEQNPYFISRNLLASHASIRNSCEMSVILCKTRRITNTLLDKGLQVRAFAYLDCGVLVSLVVFYRLLELVLVYILVSSKLLDNAREGTVLIANVV
jgi:hypothetical protein